MDKNDTCHTSDDITYNMTKRTSQEMAGFQDNSWKKCRTLKTISLFVAFFSLGLASSVVGPTLVSMQVLLDTDTKTIAATFTGYSLGYLVGAIVCGFVYAKVNKELLFVVSLISISVAMAIAPFSTHLIVFIAFNTVQAFFMGVADTAGQSYFLKVWEDHRYRQPLLQSSHAVWSFGSAIAPLVVRPFLVDIPVEDLNPPKGIQKGNTTVGYQTFANITDSPFNTSVYSEAWKEEVGFVRFAYVVIAAMILISCVLFVIVFIILGPSCLDTRRSNTNENATKDEIKSSRIFLIKLLMFMFAFYFTYLWMEDIPGNLVAVFVIKGLGWPNEHGAFVTSVYWGAHGTGRFFGMFFAFVMSPKSMLIMDLIVVTLGFALLFFVNFHISIMWIGTCVFGLGMGSTFASGILWAEKYIEITGAASSVFLAAASIGGMVSSVLTGFLMEQFTYMCFVYVLFTAGLVCLCIFIGAMIFAENSGVERKRRYSTMVLSVEEKGVELQELNSHNLISPDASFKHMNTEDTKEVMTNLQDNDNQCDDKMG